jgi:hypothetical protein
MAARKKRRRKSSGKSRKTRGRKTAAKRGSRKKARGGSRKKRKSKGRVPLKILEKRLIKLNKIIRTRGGSAYIPGPR